MKVRRRIARLAAVLLVAAAGVILLGILPGELLEAAERSAAGLLPGTAAGLTLGR